MAVSIVFKKSDSVVYTENFESGIGAWAADASDADASMDWYNSDSLRIAINTGSSGESDSLSAVWDNGLSGNFDIEVEYKRLTVGGANGTSTAAAYGLYVSPSKDIDDHILVLVKEDASVLRGRYRLSGINQETVNATTKPDVTSDNLRLRITKNGAVFTTYQDNGSGTWLQVAQFTATPFENSTMYPVLYTSRYGPTHCSARFDNFKVNSGTIVS